MRRAAVRHTASCPWPESMIASATSCKERVPDVLPGLHKLTESAMVLVSWRQDAGAARGGLKRKHRRVTGGACLMSWSPALRTRHSSGLAGGDDDFVAPAGR